MKIAIITHKTQNLAKTRKNLLQKMLDKGYEVIGICPEREYTKELEKMHIKVIVLENSRISVNIFKNLVYFLKLKKILKQEKPDIVFSYTIKPIILGSIAAKFAKVPRIYSMVAGMGYVYSSNHLRVRLIKPICNIGYKIAMKCNTRVIFQNKEDRAEFIEKGYINSENSFVVDGSGVDLKCFSKTVLPKDMNFLMMSRMLDVKGVEEYCKAAEIIKKDYPEVKFYFVGGKEDSYRKANEEIVNHAITNNIVEFEGHKKNVKEYFDNCKVFVLPTYLREGIPRTLLEALAVGRPILTTNTRGCRETVVEGENGFFVKEKDIDDLVQKMKYMIEHQESLQAMGEKSYELAKNRFEINKINENMLNFMEM